MKKVVIVLLMVVGAVSLSYDEGKGQETAYVPVAPCADDVLVDFNSGLDTLSRLLDDEAR